MVKLKIGTMSLQKFNRAILHLMQHREIEKQYYQMLEVCSQSFQYFIENANAEETRAGGQHVAKTVHFPTNELNNFFF